MASRRVARRPRIASYDARAHGALVRSWIACPKEVFHVSGARRSTLTRLAIDRWVTRSVGGFVLTVASGGQRIPIAFATLSQREADLPLDTVEIGHLLIAPAHRRCGWGTHLVSALTRFAFHRGFWRIVARVERSNAAGVNLIQQARLRFREMDPATVRWDHRNRARWFGRTRK